MIGIDIVDISRFKGKSSSFLNKIFSLKEIKEAKNGNFYEKIAGKWAAKEAAYKAGLKYANRDIEILNINKKPYIYINGKKKQYMVSISHEKKYAVAVVHINNEKI
jgi:phosphopantetheine--protein transferase-like protein